MREKLSQALEYISDRHIAEAGQAQGRKHRPYWLGAVAAVLVLVFLFHMGSIPRMIPAKAVSLAVGSQWPARPDRDDYKVWEDYRADLDIYDALYDRRDRLTTEALTALQPFFATSTAHYMRNAGNENRVWSPVNGFIALAMLTEVTDGNSRQQILQLLNAADVQTLRERVWAIWENVYSDDGHNVSVLANSMWLDEKLAYDQQVMDTLAQQHYASIYQTDLSNKKAGDALQSWLSNNTGGLLRKASGTVSFPDQSVLTVASTVYLQAKWSDKFSASQNSDGIFHAPDGPREVTFMNKKEMKGDYYWGESFGAVNLWLKNGCKMWFFLPDENKSVEDILSEGEYLALLPPSEEERENSKYMKINLTVPKFDISSGGNLASTFQSLGVTDVFNEEYSNFTAITSETPVYLTAINQASRVIIDEEGVKAASYLELPGAGASAPPEEIIDFILDRPFLFVIADTSGIPLFTGLVNTP